MLQLKITNIVHKSYVVVHKTHSSQVLWLENAIVRKINIRDRVNLRSCGQQYGVNDVNILLACNCGSLLAL